MAAGALHGAVVDRRRIQLLIDPACKAEPLHLIDLSGRWPERQPVQRVFDRGAVAGNVGSAGSRGCTVLHRNERCQHEQPEPSTDGI